MIIIIHMVLCFILGCVRSSPICFWASERIEWTFAMRYVQSLDSDRQKLKPMLLDAHEIWLIHFIRDTRTMHSGVAIANSFVNEMSFYRCIWSCMWFVSSRVAEYISQQHNTRIMNLEYKYSFMVNRSHLHETSFICGVWRGELFILPYFD